MLPEEAVDQQAAHVGGHIGSPIGSHIRPEWVGAGVRDRKVESGESPSVADSRSANDYQYRYCESVLFSMEP